MPGAAEHGAVGALQPPVEAADDLPLQAPQQPVGRRSVIGSAASAAAATSGTGSAARTRRSTASAVTSSESAS